MPQSKRSEERTRHIPHWYEPHSDVLSIVEGTGARVQDKQETEYVDFCSQLYCCNLGHDSESIRAAINEQLQKIPYVSSSKRSPVREQLAERLADISPGNLSNTFFSVSGSEANELAAHLARQYKDAPKILTRWRSYHGGTYGAGSLTGDPETRSSLEKHAATTGVGKFLPPIPGAFDTDDPDELARCASEHLEFVIKNEGPDSIAAILTEPIAGTSGAFPCPADYLKRVRALCDAYNILLISDEVITGFGRCGEWFGIQTEDVEPDMLTFAKGVTSAYVPLAGVLTGPDIATFVTEEGMALGQTFAGHPVACAAGLAAIDTYAAGPIENVRDHESLLRSGLEEIEATHDVVHDVHGRGFHWSVEFADPATGEPFHDPRVDHGTNPVTDVIEAAQERGVLFGGGRPTTQILLSPPLIVGPDEIEIGVNTLDAAIKETFS